MPISAEQCVAVLRDLLANRPADTYAAEALDWFADVAGTVSAYDQVKAVPLNMLLGQIAQVAAMNVFAGDARHNAVMRFYMEARAVFRALQLGTNAYTTAQIERGEVYNYFEELRQLIRAAEADILFIDPYIDAEFVERYLPQIPAGVSVRLLTSAGRVGSLAPALTLYRQQHQGVQVQLRTMPNQSIHDRHLVIDRRDVWQSGASFKDGAKNAPTTINQIVDVAAAMIAAHEENWNRATVDP